MSTKSTAEILSFIYQHKPDQVVYNDAWQKRLLNGLKDKNNNENQILYWLHEYLEKNDIILINKDDKEIDLTLVCEYSKDILNVKHKDWSKKYREWFGSFFSDLSNYKYKTTEQGYKHISSTIALLLREGYDFKAKETVTIDENISVYLPSCQELTKIAKEIRNNSEDKKTQPQPPQIFSIWEQINSQILNDEVRNNLIEECFRKK